MVDQILGAAEIHVPRTGGTSRTETLRSAGLAFKSGRWHATANWNSRTYPKWQEWFTWSFRRDPHEVVLSTYFYRLNKLTEPNVHIIPSGISFNEWVSIMGTVETKETPAWARGLEIRTHLPYWLVNGKPGIKVLYSFDDMESAWNEITDRLGVPGIELPHTNGAAASEGHTVEQHFSPESKEIIRERFRKDYELLGPVGETIRF